MKAFMLLVKVEHNAMYNFEIIKTINGVCIDVLMEYRFLYCEDLNSYNKSKCLYNSYNYSASEDG